MVDTLSAWAVLTAIGALLAFLIGLYTLVGRERKSPYLINSVFHVFLICMLSAAFSVASVLLPMASNALLRSSAALLLIAVLSTFWRVYRLYMRFAYLVDSGHPKHLGAWRQVKDRWRQFRGGPVYEHNAEPLGEALEAAIRDSLPKGADLDRPGLEPCSLTIALRHQGQANDVLTKLAAAFLREGHCVQYLAASRHPIEFLECLKRRLAQDDVLSWQKAAQRVVVVDAFTPHFGATDSIHLARSREIRSQGVVCIQSPMSYAGMHSASAKAFNLIKARAERDVREPVLVIYEDTYALTDLESREQYRLFIRHVLPSERQWGGMFTVFTEVAPAEAEWGLLSSYGSLSLDLRRSSTEGSCTGENSE